MNASIYGIILSNTVQVVVFYKHSVEKSICAYCVVHSFLPVARITYTVLVELLNHVQSINQSINQKHSFSQRCMMKTQSHVYLQHQVLQGVVVGIAAWNAVLSNHHCWQCHTSCDRLTLGCVVIHHLSSVKPLTAWSSGIHLWFQPRHKCNRYGQLKPVSSQKLEQELIHTYTKSQYNNNTAQPILAYNSVFVAFSYKKYMTVTLGYIIIYSCKTCTKNELHFHSQWYLPLTFQTQIWTTSYSYPGSCLHQIWSFMAFRFPVNHS